MIGTKKPRGVPIGVEKLRVLREQYLAGATLAAAGETAAVSPSTAHNKFRLFASRGLVRGAVARKVGRPCSSPTYPVNRRYPASWQLPRYLGPTWIGKRITVDTESRI